jgi:poly(3-hydroxybutyrate) depolymerase
VKIRGQVQLRRFVCSAVFCVAGAAEGGTFSVEGVEIVWREPASWSSDSRIMVLFGGRDWPGGRALREYAFDGLADKHSLFLLAPSFRDGAYWEPEAGSGKVLCSAISELEARYRLRPQSLFFYGFSAGGQCANLFYAAMPGRIVAWGAHGCGVYFDGAVSNPAPALVTCGEGDTERMAISRQFAYRYRESGGALLWKPLAGGHAVTPAALELARAWFDAALSEEAAPRWIGEDDTGRVLPARDADRIDAEFRNLLYNEALKELWQQ